MRIGTNPAKFQQDMNTLKPHRIIIPVHLPDLGIDYYLNGLDVFKLTIKSLQNSIDRSFSSITIIADGCCSEVLEYVHSIEGIDRIIVHKENKGKVYAVITEIKASYEALITVADADVYFHMGWLQASLDIFQEYPRASTVSPLPVVQHGIHYNSAVFWDRYFLGNLKYGKCASSKDTGYYLLGLNNNNLFTRSTGESWDKKHYFLGNTIEAIVGSTHFCATYRRELFKSINDFPEYKFKTDFELEFLDQPSNYQGFYRLSTKQAYVYHMGNQLDDNYTSHNPTYNPIDYSNFKLKKSNRNIVPYLCRNLYFRILKKFFKI